MGVGDSAYCEHGENGLPHDGSHDSGDGEPQGDGFAADKALTDGGTSSK